MEARANLVAVSFVIKCQSREMGGTHRLDYILGSRHLAREETGIPLWLGSSYLNLARAVSGLNH